MKRATNSSEMKIRNRKIILDLIRREKISRTDIARLTGLTKAAVSIIIDKLAASGLVSEAAVEVGSPGRRPMLLSINKDYYYAVGVNITRSDFSVGIFNLAGESVCEKGGDISGCTLDTIIELIKELIKPFYNKVLGIGVTAPGPVDEKNGIVLNPPNFNKWHNVKIGEELKKALNLNVFVENIANGWALCESYFGACRNAGDFMTLLVDEGVGSGIIINNKIFRGINELGHTSIKFDGIKCECGNTGCLEKYASIPAILDGTEYTSWREAVDSKDIKLIGKEAEYLSAAIVNAANLFKLDTVVIASDISYRPEEFIKILEEKVNSKILAGSGLKIRKTQISSEALCGASLVFYDFYN